MSNVYNVAIHKESMFVVFLYQLLFLKRLKGAERDFFRAETNKKIDCYATTQVRGGRMSVLKPILYQLSAVAGCLKKKKELGEIGNAFDVLLSGY